MKLRAESRWNRVAVLAGMMVAVMLLPAATASGQEMATVGQVVEFPNGEVRAFCRELETPIDNVIALQANGLDLVIKDWGFGYTVCRIEGVGCAEDECFCQCPMPECELWTFFRWNKAEGAWEKTEDTTVQAGDIVAWLWTELDTQADYPWPALGSPSLKDVTLSKVCELEEEQVFQEQFVPEPGTLLLLGSGVAGLAAYAGMKKRASGRQSG